ncbi:MAG: DUF2207 domain-containing protein, partial [Campylobacterota bacterium]|nr:DUF2207 domain-containing protein [Campylobacterota bacterium]
MYKLILFLFLGLGVSLYAEKISAYKIDVTVKQSGELFIVESILYDFENASKHGIFRDIPFTVKINSHTTNLILDTFSVKLDDGVVEWDAMTVNNTLAGKTTRIKIGSASTYLTGEHLYKISYRVQKGVLPAVQNEKNDAVRWNVIGTGWQVPIANIEANFYLPASLTQDAVELSTYTGSFGTKNSTATSHWVNPLHLQVKVGSLLPFEGTTVELAYP